MWKKMLMTVEHTKSPIMLDRIEGNGTCNIQKHEKYIEMVIFCCMMEGVFLTVLEDCIVGRTG